MLSHLLHGQALLLPPCQSNAALITGSCKRFHVLQKIFPGIVGEQYPNRPIVFKHAIIRSRTICAFEETRYSGLHFLNAGKILITIEMAKYRWHRVIELLQDSIILAYHVLKQCQEILSMRDPNQLLDILDIIWINVVGELLFEFYNDLHALGIGDRP